MKQTIWIVFLLGIVFTSSSCFLNPDEGNATQALVIYSELEEEEEEDRRGGARSEYRGSRAGRCEDDSSCENICEDLYDNDEGSIDECGELRTGTVEEMEELRDALDDDDVTVKQLKRLQEDTFSRMLEISVYPWVRVVTGVSRTTHAETILAWIASNSEVLQAIARYGGTADYNREHRSFEALAFLLEEVAGYGTSDCEKYYSALGLVGAVPVTGSSSPTLSSVPMRDTTIASGQTFIEIAVTSGVLDNNSARDYLFNIYRRLPADLDDDDDSTTCE